MTYEEIISRLRQRDERVTSCFFFWDGPTLQRIDDVRRVDPSAAAKMKRPVCHTCRPALLAVLHKLYGAEHFDYQSLVSDFYMYLIEKDKFATIKDPNTLMGWISITAYYFFLNAKIKTDKVLENSSDVALNSVSEDEIKEDDSRMKSREFVEDVISAMPNKVYAKILEDIVLEAGQYSGRAKSELIKRKSRELDIPIDNLYVKISLAKKQFKQVALKMNKS